MIITHQKDIVNLTCPKQLSDEHLYTNADHNLKDKAPMRRGVYVIYQLLPGDRSRISQPLHYLDGTDYTTQFYG